MAVVVGGAVVITIIVVVSLVFLRLRSRNKIDFASNAGSSTSPALGGVTVFDNPVYEAEYPASNEPYHSAGYQDVSSMADNHVTSDGDLAVVSSRVSTADEADGFELDA